MHVVPNHLHRPDKWKRTMCTFHLQGRCTKGATCTYAHSTAELRMPGPRDRGNGDLGGSSACMADSWRLLTNAHLVAGHAQACICLHAQACFCLHGHMFQTGCGSGSLPKHTGILVLKPKACFCISRIRNQWGLRQAQAYAGPCMLRLMIRPREQDCLTAMDILCLYFYLDLHHEHGWSLAKVIIPAPNTCMLRFVCHTSGHPCAVSDVVYLGLPCFWSGTPIAIASRLNKKQHAWYRPMARY